MRVTDLSPGYGGQRLQVRVLPLVPIGARAGKERAGNHNKLLQAAKGCVARLARLATPERPYNFAGFFIHLAAGE